MRASVATMHSGLAWSFDVGYSFVSMEGCREGDSRDRQPRVPWPRKVRERIWGKGLV